MVCHLGGQDLLGHMDPANLSELPADPVVGTIKRVNESGHYSGRVVTEVTPFTVLYPAEKYHQNYFALHPDQPYIQKVSLPKVEKLRKAMAGHLKDESALTMMK